MTDTEALVQNLFDQALQAARTCDEPGFEFAVREALDLDHVVGSRTAEAMLVAELRKLDPRSTGTVEGIAELSEQFAARSDQVAMPMPFMYELTIRRALDEPGAGEQVNVLQTVIYALQMVRFLRDDTDPALP